MLSTIDKLSRNKKQTSTQNKQLIKNKNSFDMICL